MASYLYYPSKVIVTIDGQTMTGFGDSDMIKAKWLDEDRAKVMQGVLGDISVAVSAQNAVEFTLTLTQTSPSNDHLSLLYEKMQSGAGGAFAITVTDLSGNAKAFSPSAFITKTPGMERGKEVKTQEWVIVGSDGVLLPLGASAS